MPTALTTPHSNNFSKFILAHAQLSWKAAQLQTTDWPLAYSIWVEEEFFNRTKPRIVLMITLYPGYIEKTDFFPEYSATVDLWIAGITDIRVSNRNYKQLCSHLCTHPQQVNTVHTACSVIGYSAKSDIVSTLGWYRIPYTNNYCI